MNLSCFHLNIPMPASRTISADAPQARKYCHDGRYPPFWSPSIIILVKLIYRYIGLSFIRNASVLFPMRLMSYIMGVRYVQIVVTIP